MESIKHWYETVNSEKNFITGNKMLFLDAVSQLSALSITAKFLWITKFFYDKNCDTHCEKDLELRTIYYENNKFHENFIHE